MSQIIVITGASSGFGNLTAKALGHAGHTVYAGTREAIQNNKSADDLAGYAKTESVDLRPVELNVLSEQSLKSGIDRIIKEAGRIDVLIHNAGHMTFGPTEAFTPEQLMAEYDLNCVGTHRLNRIALPHMRKAGKGLIVWVGSSSTRGGTFFRNPLAANWDASYDVWLQHCSYANSCHLNDRCGEEVKS